MKIVDVKALQILDSRGNPTIQVKVLLSDGAYGVFSVPSGASTGSYEAYELRDGNEKLFHGKSVLRAVENVNRIRYKLINKEFSQRELDKFLCEIDGSENKSVLGANAILGISIAFAKACAMSLNLPVYEYINLLVRGLDFSSNLSRVQNLKSIPLFSNIINGGLHSGNLLNVQEFMIVPDLGSVPENIRAISEIYHTLKGLIEKKYGKSNTSVGDEGGFAPDIKDVDDALKLIVEAIDLSGYNGSVFIALDAAASDFYDENSGLYEVESGKKLNRSEMIGFYKELVKKYPIISIEDAFSEDDFDGFKEFYKVFKRRKNRHSFYGRFLSVGDDLLVTNPKRIEVAVNKGLCNALLLKINQIGTLSESLEAYKLAKKNGWDVIVSHRSGETTDDFIADLAVGLSSAIKIGAPARGERIAKYNRLLNIYNFNF